MPESQVRGGTDVNAAGATSPYEVELLYGAMPELSEPELLRALGERCGTAESGGRDPLAFVFPDLQAPGADAPVRFELVPAEGRVPEGELEEALLQTRDWRDGRAAVARHRARLVVRDRNAAGLPYKNRLKLFHHVLIAVVEQAAPLAIYWRPAGKLVGPLVLARARGTNGQPDPIRLAINVRCGPASDGSGAQVMDTLGLAPLGLPDLECVFRDKDPAKMEAFLRAFGRYLFDLGDVIPDGRVLRGPEGEGKYVCARGRAVEPPARDVIRLQPA